jgi:hypothetical protein
VEVLKKKKKKSRKFSENFSEIFLFNFLQFRKIGICFGNRPIADFFHDQTIFLKDYELYIIGHSLNWVPNLHFMCGSNFYETDVTLLVFIFIL